MLSRKRYFCFKNKKVHLLLKKSPLCVCDGRGSRPLSPLPVRRAPAVGSAGISGAPARRPPRASGPGPARPSPPGPSRGLCAAGGRLDGAGGRQGLGSHTSLPLGLSSPRGGRSCRSPATPKRREPARCRRAQAAGAVLWAIEDGEKKYCEN